ncbi:MAG: hypothetical protein U0905_01750 [Pirellulales bacterium]
MFEAPKKVQVDWKGQEPPKPRWAWWKPGPTDWVTQWRTTPVVFDFQKDGLMDLIMLDQEELPRIARAGTARRPATSTAATSIYRW